MVSGAPRRGIVGVTGEQAKVGEKMKLSALRVIAAAAGAVAGFAVVAGAFAQTAATFTGTWGGAVEQPGRDQNFTIVVTIPATGAPTTSYPDEGCSGTLTRIGASGVYVFYVEKITKGKYDPAKGTGCLDGTITLARSGDKVLLSWFGTVDNGLYQASATLTKR
jgi:hypothetical protein